MGVFHRQQDKDARHGASFAAGGRAARAFSNRLGHFAAYRAPLNWGFGGVCERGGIYACTREGRPSFLKKRSKKLLLLWARFGEYSATAYKLFLVPAWGAPPFFQKRPGLL
jgi:hypothetical protein